MMTVRDPKVVAALEDCGVKVSKPPGTVLFRRGDEPHGVYLIISGSVETTVQDVPPQLRRTVSAGALLGVPASLDAVKGYSMTATVAKRAEVVRISKRRLLDLMRNNSTVAVAIVAMLSAEVHEMRYLFERLKCTQPT